MSTIIVQPEAVGASRVRHIPSNVEIRVTAPEEFGGPGGSFSSTDLLAAALGSCIASSIDRIAQRSNLPLKAVQVMVDKELGQDPKRVKRLNVTIQVGAPLDPLLKTKLERAARTCPVHRSLAADIAVGLTLVEHRRK